MNYPKIMICILLIETGLLFTKRFQTKRIYMLLMALGYAMVVLWLTILSRSPDPKYTIIFSFFSAFRKAIVIDGGLDYFINTLFSNGLWASLKLIHIRLYHLEGVVLNVLLFIPLGYILPVLWPRMNIRILIISIAVTCSCMIEILQSIWHLGVGEFDDIINNLIGALIGFRLYSFFVHNMNTDLTIC